jgi:hypothetical protein
MNYRHDNNNDAEERMAVSRKINHYETTAETSFLIGYAHLAIAITALFYYCCTQRDIAALLSAVIGAAAPICGIIGNRLYDKCITLTFAAGKYYRLKSLEP